MQERQLEQAREMQAKEMRASQAEFGTITSTVLAQQWRARLPRASNWTQRHSCARRSTAGC